MLKGCYTFKELKERFGWDTNAGQIDRQISYAKKRGVIIEKAFKEGKTYFQIISILDELDDEWKIYPNNHRFEVSISGKVRDVETKKILGSSNGDGYICVVDSHQTPCKSYRVHRMVMETFKPIENSENYIVDHIDGVRCNNQLSNLRWVTQRTNMYHRDDNFAIISQNLQKLIEKRGYDWVNRLLLLELEE